MWSFFKGMNIPLKVISYTPADEVTLVFNFSSLSPQECCYKCFNVVKSSVSFPFVLRQIYAKWKLFSKYLYIYLFMFPISRLLRLLHCAFKSFLCLRIFFVSVSGSLLVGRNTLLFTAPPLSVLRITICPPLDRRIHWLALSLVLWCLHSSQHCKWWSKWWDEILKSLKIRIVNRLLVAFDKGWICFRAGAKTEASQQTATLANMTESGYDRNTHTKN